MSFVWEVNLSFEEGILQKIGNFSYLSLLEFSDPKIKEKAISAWKKKNIYSVQKNWLGIYFREALEKRSFPDLMLKWVGEEIGCGLFTMEDLPAFTLIGEYTGIVKKKPYLENPQKNRYLIQYPIGFWSFGSWVIDAKDQGNYCRFINHSNRNNVTLKSFLYGGVVHLGIVTKEKIPKHSQLLLHYGDHYWKQLQEKPLDLISK